MATGKTHKSITNIYLRKMFAKELLAIRQSRKHTEFVSSDYANGLRDGVETTYIRVQQYLTAGKVNGLE